MSDNSVGLTKQSTRSLPVGCSLAVYVRQSASHMSWRHSSRNSAATRQWWDGMPVDHWSKPFRWLCWWCQQTLRWWECPRKMPSSVFPYSPGNSWECIIPGWSMMLVQRRGSFHWTRHAAWYSWRSPLMWVYCNQKLLRALSRFTSVVITVSGWAGGESIIGPNTTSVLGFWAEPAIKRSCWALKPAHSTGLSFPWTCDSHAASRCWLNMTAADWTCDSSADRAFVGSRGGFTLEGPE